MNKKTIYFKDGSSLSLSDAEAEGIKKAIESGERFVDFQGEFVSVDNIARIGRHECSAQVSKIERNSVELGLLRMGRKDLVDRRMEIQKKKSIDSARKQKMLVGKEYVDWLKQAEEKPQIPQSNREAIKGEPAYYLNEYGEKIYS